MLVVDGLVGIELKKNGFNNIDGADFSQKMLFVPENIYSIQILLRKLLFDIME